MIRKVGSLLLSILGTAISQYLCILFGWTAGQPLYGVEIVLWAIVWVMLPVVYWGLPGKVPWKKKLAGTVGIFILAYVLCWIFIPIVGYEAGFAYIVVNYTVWTILLEILFTWLGL